jgi:hypothetical protein
MSTPPALIIERDETRPVPAPSQTSRADWTPTLVVAAAMITIGIAGVRGADYPAHFLRALLWERSGVSAWNNLWYAGHATPTYSVIAPPLMAWLGPFWVIALSSVAAIAVFGQLARDVSATPRLSELTFALALVVNAIVGRAPFALGLALGLSSVLAWRRGWLPLALVAAVATPLASPVAGAFLVLTATAVALVTRRRQAIAMVVAGAGPLVIASLLFGGPGRFPFRGVHYVAATFTLALLTMTTTSRIVRTAAVLAIATCTLLFVVPNPLGGNFVRLCHTIAIPLAVASVPAVRRSLRPLVAVALVTSITWSLQPGVVAARDWIGDESLDAAYYEPLAAQLRARNGDGRPVGRVEIPFTKNHWESFFVVAEDIPYARGWERQVDLERNEPLYDATLTIEEYHDWLLANGVRWIAIPDVTLDHAGVIEQRLVDSAAARGVTWLRPVWFNADWRLFEVGDYTPIVGTPAALVEQAADYLVIRTERAATVTIRYHYTEYLTATGGACVVPDGEGWIVATLPRPGEYRLSVDPAGVLLGTARDSRLCGSSG